MKLYFNKGKIKMLRNKLGIHGKLYVKCPVPQFNLYICLPKSILYYQWHLEKNQRLLPSS